MIIAFGVGTTLLALVTAGLLTVGWAINQPPKGKRAKPTAEDQRTITAWLAGEQWSASFWPSERPRLWRRVAALNVSRAGNPPGRSDGATAPGKVAAVKTPGPGHHHDDCPEAACDGCTVLGCKPGCKCACHWETFTVDLLAPAPDVSRPPGPATPPRGTCGQPSEAAGTNGGRPGHPGEWLTCFELAELTETLLARAGAVLAGAL